MERTASLPDPVWWPCGAGPAIRPGTLAAWRSIRRGRALIGVAFHGTRGAMPSAPDRTGPSSADLAALLGRCAAGEQAALRALYDALAPSLYGAALRITRDAGLASDAVQDAFVQLWQRAARFDPARGDPAGWIASIVRYRALDIVRRRGRETLGYEPGSEPDEAPDPLTRLIGSTEAEALRRCLALLDATRRQLLVLAYSDGLTHAELAARTGHPLGTVKAWIRRSLVRLRECLDA